MWDFLSVFFGFFLPFTFLLLWWKLQCFFSNCKQVILCNGMADTKARLSDFKVSKKLFKFLRYDILKIVYSKFKKVWIWLMSECQTVFFSHSFAYYDSLLPIGTDEITKRLHMWLNNPQYGHKERGKFPIFWWDNHQGKSCHIYLLVSLCKCWSIYCGEYT